jgi:uncharacterized membrane protein YebE (DUF533 family)
MFQAAQAKTSIKHGSLKAALVQIKFSENGREKSQWLFRYKNEIARPLSIHSYEMIILIGRTYRQSDARCVYLSSLIWIDYHSIHLQEFIQALSLSLCQPTNIPDSLCT